MDFSAFDAYTNVGQNFDAWAQVEPVTQDMGAVDVEQLMGRADIEQRRQLEQQQTNYLSQLQRFNAAPQQNQRAEKYTGGFALALY
jgi:hypothetical protein